MKAPFPYFGGKARVAQAVWERLGDTPNYVEPFFGSGAVLLARPDMHQWWAHTETVNDADGMAANYWRATQAEPDAVARWADWPINENDLHARHAWLVGQKSGLQARLEGNPDYYDAQVAGWWLWGICIWIGSGWCSGKGPWVVEDGELVRQPGHSGAGINRQLPHLGGAGRGINRQPGIAVSPDGSGHAEAWSAHLQNMMRRLSDRLRRVRVCCGDWSRVCGPMPTIHQGLTGVFLDPPYAEDVGRDMRLYAVDDGQVAADVRRWAIEHGDDPRMRIALCGYEAPGWEMPRGWTAHRWKTLGGYGNQGNGRGRENADREVVWFSPHCLGAAQLGKK